MSREKIKEMTEILKDYTKKQNIMASVVILEDYAEELYNAGYRKQSKGEWKQTEEPLGWGNVSCVECSVCGESWVLDDDAIYFDLVNDYWKYCPNCGAKMKGGE